jgi:hypothetical protein
MPEFQSLENPLDKQIRDLAFRAYAAECERLENEIWQLIDFGVPIERILVLQHKESGKKIAGIDQDYDIMENFNVFGYTG